jgi:hypothetical protein
MLAENHDFSSQIIVELCKGEIVLTKNVQAEHKNWLEQMDDI